MADTLTQTHFDDTIKRLFETVATRDDLAKTNVKVVAISDGLTEVKGEVATFHDDLAGVKAGMVATRADLAEVIVGLRAVGAGLEALRNSVDNHLHRSQAQSEEFAILKARYDSLCRLLVKKGIATEKELSLLGV